MRKLVVLTFVSLDGVMQAPGGKGEDPSGGFDLEGWVGPYFDEDGGKEMAEQMSMPAELLLGRKTFEIFSGFWPTHSDQWPHINEMKKYVVSNGEVNLDWNASIQIKGDVVSEIKKLKEEDGPILQVHGSSSLIQTLLANDLIDELWLKTFPITLGKGKRLFGEGTKPAAFKLLNSNVTKSGVIFAKYARDGKLKLQDIED